MQVIVIFQSVQKEEKFKKFFESLIARISGIAEEIFFKFGMWPPTSGRHLNCKFGSMWIRHHRATYVKIATLLLLSIYSLRLQAPIFWGCVTYRPMP